MKIIEIVDTTINEASPLTSIAKHVTGWGAKLLGGGQRKRLIDRFAGIYKPDHIMTTVDLARIQNKFPHENPNKVAKEILERSKKLENLRVTRANIEDMKARFDTIAKLATSTWKTAIGTAYAAALYAPINEYIKAMRAAESRLNANVESERISLEQFEKIHTTEMVKLVGQLASVLATVGLMQAILRVPTYFLPKVIKVPLRTLGNAGIAYLANSMANDATVREAIAGFMVSEWFGTTGVQRVIGNIGTGLESILIDRIEDAKKQTGQATTGQPPANATSVSAPKSTTGQPPASATPTTSQATPKTQPASPQKSTKKNPLEPPIKPEEWEFYTKDMVRHIPTGEVFSKITVFGP